MATNHRGMEISERLEFGANIELRTPPLQFETPSEAIIYYAGNGGNDCTTDTKAQYYELKWLGR